MVINYERERLMKNIIIKFYVDKIIYVFESGDGYGYDIIFYDINLDVLNEVIEIYIEVKIMIGNRDVLFYLLDNELNVVRIKGEFYKIYWVYDYNIVLKLKIIDNLFDEILEIKLINYIVKGVN